jgi:sugar (pentulose or hexulose) kinase
MTYVILLDIGGTFLKGTTYSPSHQVEEPIIRREGPPLRQTKEGIASLDPARLVSEVKQLCQELIDRSPGRCEGIYLTGQMHGVVLVDSHGQPQTEVITWRDSLKAQISDRLLSPVEIISRELGTEQIYSLGNELREGLPIATLVARQSRGQRVTGFTPHSLISFCAAALADFTSPPLMHVTDAAAHGFFNVLQARWDHAALDTLGLSGLLLPSVTERVDQCGFSKQFGCPIYVALGDQQAALFGSELETGELSLNIATGSQVSAIQDVPNPATQVRPYFERKYLSTITHIPAGRALNALVCLITELAPNQPDELWTVIASKVEAEEESRLEIDLSFFPSATGSVGKILNIQERDLTVGQVVRSSIYAMSRNYRRFAKMIFPEEDYTAIVLSGGLTTRFRPLKKAIEEEFGPRRYRISESEDASLMGLQRLSTPTLA